MKGRFQFFPNLCALAEGPEYGIIGYKQFVVIVTRNQQIAYILIPKFLWVFQCICQVLNKKGGSDFPVISVR